MSTAALLPVVATFDLTIPGYFFVVLSDGYCVRLLDVFTEACELFYLKALRLVQFGAFGSGAKQW